MTPAFVFPTARQKERLRRLVGPEDGVVLAHPDIAPADGASGLREQEAAPGDAAPAGRWLVLHELGVYHLRTVDPAPETTFGARCLDMLTKTGAAAVFDLAGVRRAPKADAPLDGPLPAEPPFVVKPDFGFGSQLVKVVRDEAQWRAYADVARTPSGVRARYGRAYFADEPGLLDRFVAEPLLDGTFLSVPFVWDGAAVTAFPVSGAEAASTASTDFHWERFEAPARIDPAAFAALESDLARLAGPCELRPGVFEAELLLLAGGELCFLEFSPRPTGGVVPELVWHAYGVDIDELAVRCFLGERPAVARDAARPVLGVRSPAAAPPDESLELLSEQAGAGGRLVDRVYAAA